MTADQIQGEVWVVPAEAMKNGKAHRVPITPQMRALLPHRDEGIVWQGPKGELSNAAMYRLLKKRMGRDYSVHGFRSSFRDWVAEKQPGMGDAAERQLSHVNSNETEAAYLRTDLLEQRQKLMGAWAQFVTGG